MVNETGSRTARPIRALPTGAELECPPRAPVAQIHGMLRRIKYQRAGFQHVREGTRVILRVGRDLRIGNIAGHLDELAEFSVGDRSAIDLESVDVHRVDRRLLGVMLVRPHIENAAGDPDHVDISRYLRAGIRDRAGLAVFRHSSFPQIDAWRLRRGCRRKTSGGAYKLP